MTPTVSRAARMAGLLAAILTIALARPALAAPPKDGACFQTSTIGALLRGLYDGTMTIAELSRHGNMGIGTLDQIDGEMICLDGRFYQARSDGKILRVPGTVTTPFATVTYFRPERRLELRGPMNLAAMENKLAEFAQAGNAFCAFRIHGRFRSAKTRSVPRQQRPYVSLVKVAEKQSVFHREDVTGTVLGFQTPDYMTTVNVPGLHLHFLSDDHTFGGHLLDLEVDDIVVELQVCRRFELSLPADPAFDALDLRDSQRADLMKVERSHN